LKQFNHAEFTYIIIRTNQNQNQKLNLNLNQIQNLNQNLKPPEPETEPEKCNRKSGKRKKWETEKWKEK